MRISLFFRGVGSVWPGLFRSLGRAGIPAGFFLPPPFVFRILLLLEQLRFWRLGLDFSHGPTLRTSAGRGRNRRGSHRGYRRGRSYRSGRRRMRGESFVSGNGTAGD